ncbi:acetyl-CoA carboxylase biotin carboxyl carrier protein [Anaerotignum sp.]
MLLACQNSSLLQKRARVGLTGLLQYIRIDETMDTNKIAELAKILRQNQLIKLDLTEGDNRIVLEAASGRAAAVEAPVFVPVETAAEMPVEAAVAAEQAETPAGVEQKSPLVGTVYLAPQAGAEPFVKVGDKVKKGDVLCIVESMKMFNNIEAELEGTIEEVCVDNGQIVEFGQPLVRILPE